MEATAAATTSTEKPQTLTEKYFSSGAPSAAVKAKYEASTKLSRRVSGISQITALSHQASSVGEAEAIEALAVLKTIEPDPAKQTLQDKVCCGGVIVHYTPIIINTTTNIKHYFSVSGKWSQKKW